MFDVLQTQKHFANSSVLVTIHDFYIEINGFIEYRL
jgi:hypothetical protein